MDKLFQTVLNMSLTGAFVIAVVCLVRLPLKKAPKIISYCLWAVVGLRLLFPFSIESAVSLIPFEREPVQSTWVGKTYTYEEWALAPEGTIDPDDVKYYDTPPDTVIVGLGSYIWPAGAALMLIYGFVSYFQLKRRMRSAIRTDGNVYESDAVHSPFVLGIFKPKIYIPLGLAGQEREYILLHEQTHIRRCDHIVKFAAYFILCLHWFNPLVWAAFLLMGADMEMSCDERVLKELGAETKKEYSMSLLSLATYRRMIGGSPLAFSEGGLKERIKNVLNFKKSSRVVITLAVALVVLLSACFVVNRADSESEQPAVPTPAPTLAPAPVAENISMQEPPPVAPHNDGWEGITQMTSGSLNIETYNGITTQDGFSNQDYIKAKATIYSSIDDLKHLIFDEVKLTEREFDDVSSLQFSTAYDNIKITRGGSKLFVKYYEWFENQYSLSVNGGELTFEGNWLPYYLRTGNEATNMWYVDYLKSQGKQPHNTIEIVIPESMTFDKTTLSTAYGNINILGDSFSGMDISTAYGQINIDGNSVSGMDISTAYGQINIEGDSFSAMDISTAYGQINVKGRIFKNTNISTAYGDVYITPLDSIKNYNISLSTSGGKLTYNGKIVEADSLSNQNADSELDLSSTSGSVNITGTD